MSKIKIGAVNSSFSDNVSEKIQTSSVVNSTTLDNSYRGVDMLNSNLLQIDKKSSVNSDIQRLREKLKAQNSNINNLNSQQDTDDINYFTGVGKIADSSSTNKYLDEGLKSLNSTPVVNKITLNKQSSLKSSKSLKWLAIFKIPLFVKIAIFLLIFLAGAFGIWSFLRTNQKIDILTGQPVSVEINLADYNLSEIEYIELNKTYPTQISWLESNFNYDQLADDVNVEASADFDKDGVGNAIEMILGTDPKRSEISPDENTKSHLVNKLLVDKAYISDNTVNTIGKIINKGCVIGVCLFNNFNNYYRLEGGKILSSFEIDDNFAYGTVGGFDYFYKTQKVVVQNRILDLTLNALNDDREPAQRSKIKLEDTLKKLKEYSYSNETGLSEEVIRADKIKYQLLYKTIETMILALEEKTDVKISIEQYLKYSSAIEVLN